VAFSFKLLGCFKGESRGQDDMKGLKEKKNGGKELR
jgi:hypothetical protein